MGRWRPAGAGRGGGATKACGVTPGADLGGTGQPIRGRVAGKCPGRLAGIGRWAAGILTHPHPVFAARGPPLLPADAAEAFPMRYRHFRNADPPALVALWNESLTHRG